MPITVVVGGMYGSCGKGKYVHHLTLQDPSITCVAKVGGPNAGHTIIDENGKHVFQHLPSATPALGTKPNVKLILCATCLIDPDILRKEITAYKITPDQLMIDPKAAVIYSVMKNFEKEQLEKLISSTCSGTGMARLQRLTRSMFFKTVADLPEFASYLGDTTQFMSEELAKGNRVILEGTQGYGLSLVHSGNYPYVTSTDCIAASVLSDAGLSPLNVDRVAMVIRTYPIRVSGNSGNLRRETTWGFVTIAAGSDTPIEEYTTVTNKLRRVGRFDSQLVRDAIRYNQPNQIILNHMDYFPEVLWKTTLEDIETEIGQKIDLIGTGPDKFITRKQLLEE